MLRILLISAIVVLLAPTIASARMPAPPLLIAHHAENPDCLDEGVPVACAGVTSGELWLPHGSGRYARAHETGHLWFAQVPTDEQRAWFIRQLRLKVNALGGQLTDGGWYRGTGIHGDDSPDELAAEAYATCDLGYSPAPRRRHGALVVRWPVSYDYYPTLREHRMVCNAIAFLGYVAAHQSTESKLMR